ncbi:MAG: hypothetical protein JSU63_10310 [Phycisphaerales bacterium]|nr:MAG: hypothetical protein JSU63_10310 [Phycisphaerales bacterium]
MAAKTDFTARLEAKVGEQLHSQRVGYLLGAGASYLDGREYPLAGALWDCIRTELDPEYRAPIQAKLDEGADGLEHALDLLDTGGPADSPYRHAVTDAIASHFAPRT